MSEANFQSSDVMDSKYGQIPSSSKAPSPDPISDWTDLIGDFKAYVKKGFVHHQLAYFFPSKRYRQQVCVSPTKNLWQKIDCFRMMEDDEEFWENYWSDDPQTLGHILDATRPTRKKANRQRVGDYFCYKSLLTLNKLLDHTNRILTAGLQAGIGTNPLFYLCDITEERDVLVHSHDVLQKTMRYLAGWQIGDLGEKTKFYKYQISASSPVTALGLAWPDLRDTPTLYLLRFANFVNKTQGMTLFNLCIFVPGELRPWLLRNDAVRNDQSCKTCKGLIREESHQLGCLS